MSLRKRQIGGVAVLVAVLASVAAAGIFLYQRSRVQRELAAVIAGLDERDPGWRLAEIEDARTGVAAEVDSAALILQIHRKVPPKWLMEDAEAKWREQPPQEPLPPEEVARFEPRMAQIEALLPELRRLADRSRGRFTITYTKDVISTLLPHVQDVREIANVLEQLACWQAHNGDLDGALVSCRAGLNTAHSLDGEPLLISQLVRAACVRLALNGLQRTLASGDASAASLAEMQRALAEVDRHDSSVVGLRGERAAMHLLCNNLENGTVSISHFMAMARAAPGTGTGFAIADRAVDLTMATSVPAAHVWLLKHFTEAIDTCKLPGPKQQDRVKELHEAPAQAPGLARLLAPAWIKCHEVFRRQKSHLRCAVVAVAVERYRLKHGPWPKDLKALQPEFLDTVPLDPYTDAPLNHRRTADGVVVFSVGPDGSQRGDFRDHPLDATNPGHDAEFEFRLWDPTLRRR